MQLEQAVQCLGFKSLPAPVSCHAVSESSDAPPWRRWGLCARECSFPWLQTFLVFSLRSWREPVIQINHDRDGDCGLQLF